MDELDLSSGPYRLVLAPKRGGSVSRFDWHGNALFRATCGPSILDTACFPLVPFSNRIAFGRFYDGDRTVQLAPNFPGADHPHTIHGFGWLAEWEVCDASGDQAVLRHHHAAGRWPWPYVAEQRFTVDGDGLTHQMSLTNLGSTPMPAGLGFHPYFPRSAQTFYRGLHRSEWVTAVDGLPLFRTVSPDPKDWWGGLPVERRCLDTAFQGREGALSIHWRDRGIRLFIEPSPELDCTLVYTPADADFFCVEPVSHATDAINRRLPDDGLQWLAAKAVFRVAVRYRAEAG